MAETNHYTENAEKWRALADIDYITHFVKAWISFNAWYKNCYPDLTTDSAIINEIKMRPNTFKDNLENLLKGENTDSILFKNEISNLHYRLERHTVRNNQEKISFENITIERNPKHYEKLERNTLIYEITRESGNHKIIDSKITDRPGRIKFTFSQTNSYDLDELITCNEYLKLSKPQKDNLAYCYKELDPNKKICLLATEDDCIQIGNYSFINDSEKMCKGIITVLYLLRNSLFHGEIIPNRDTNRVYESAYHILHQLVGGL